MATLKEDEKFQEIFSEWFLGFKKDSAKKIKSLTKRQFFYLLEHWIPSHVENFHHAKDFKLFIGRVLEGIFDHTLMQ